MQDNNLTTKKVALGMSGGVDSSLSAHFLKQQGFEVTGVYLECWRAPGCRTEQDRKDALQVALSLGIPFKVLDFKDTYKAKVVEYFFDEYQKGRTPNPDVLCNKEIKFGLFYNWAMNNGFDYIATGHYAKVGSSDQQLTLQVPKDAHKDQTYFLYRLKKEQLPHILFPLADLTKKEVRQEAKKRDIHVSDKKDSVGICFIGDINVTSFLKDRLGEKPGEVVDTKGNVIGKHKGIWFYTIGQRHGFDIDNKVLIKTDTGETIIKQNIPPFYVISKNAAKNQLVVGFGSETLSDHFNLDDTHWINSQPDQNSPLFVRIRHTGQLLAGQLIKKDDQLLVKLDEAIQGIAEGQSAVFYTQQDRNLICLGGGVIKY